MERYKILWQRDQYNKRLCKRMALYNRIDSIVSANNTLSFLPPINNSVFLSDEEMARFLVARQLSKKQKLADRLLSHTFTNTDYKRMYNKAWSIITVDMIYPPTMNELSEVSMGVLTPLMVINAISWDRTLEFLRD